MKKMWDTAHSIYTRDPAAKSVWEVFFLYPGFHVLGYYRIGNFFYRHKHTFIARMFGQCGRFWTGIEIHPGATIGRRLFIDHGFGTVIGETSIIGDDCTVYHDVTLGGTTLDAVKRHPTLGNGVTVGAGAQVLGPINLGDYSRVGANAVVVKDVAPNTTVVGIPARVVESGKDHGA
ncbi:MAG: serine O-acetyltransferase EpsC [Erysipelotrichaceae bacterium]